MTRAAIGVLLSHWQRHPFQLATLMIGLAMATALWAGVQAINAEAKAGYTRAGNLAMAINLPSVGRADGADVTLADFASLRRAGHQVSPVLEGVLRAGNGNVRVLGIDPISHPIGPRLFGSLMVAGAVNGVVGGQNLGVADPATATQISTSEGFWKVQPAAGLPPGLVLADIAQASRLLDQPEGLTRIVLAGGQPETLPEGYRVVAAAPATDFQGLTDSFHLNLTAFGFLSFAVGLFILHSGINLAIEQRRATLRTVRAIGLPMRRLVILLSLELLVIALVSASLGLVLGYLIAGALMPDVALTLRGLYGAPVAGELALRPSWIVAGLGLALAGTALAGGGAVFRVSRLPLLAPAMPRTWARSAQGSGIRLVGLGMVVFGAGFAIHVAIGGLMGGFALLGGALVGAAMMLPFILAWILKRLGAGARRPIGQWFWSDTYLQLPGLSLALMALMLALAANIGVNAMVSSFRIAFQGFLDQRLLSDMYLSASTDAEGARIAKWLEPRTEAVFPIWHSDEVILDRPAEVYGIIDHARYRETWPMITATPDAWARIYDGSGALVSEQLANRGQLKLGDEIRIDGQWSMKVVGTYADYGNPGGQMIVALELLLTQRPGVTRTRYGVVVAPERVQGLMDQLVETFDIRENSLGSREQLKKFSLSVFERTFAVTAALNALTLMIAGFAIATSLLTLANMRLPQVAPVWALGLTRSKIAFLELARALVLAGLTFLLALPVGLGLSWVLLKVINREAFGWTLPIHLFPSDWAVLFGLALLAGGLSALIPAMRIRRLTPAQLAKVFSSAR